MATLLADTLELNRRAVEARDYEVAYHLLMAALHLADHARDAAALERIAQLAKEQGAAVEAAQPPHHLSRAHAQMRGQTAVFDSLFTHIDAVRLRMHSDEQRARRPQ